MKLALIGGGGVRTVFFCQSLAKYAGRLGIEELRLMDTDREKLSTFGYLSQYAVREHSGLKITLTESIEEAVTGVDYVVTAFRVGGDEARVLDERTALNLGVLGQETTGAGGFSYAARTVPVMLEYMRVIAEKSNDATVFNFTNPSGLVTQALYDAGYENTIGICDNATGTKINLAEALEVDARDLFVRVYGLNHLTWADSVRLRGAEILPTLMKSGEFIENYHDFLYYDRDLIRSLGALPNGYLYYYYHREQALANILSAEQTRGESIVALNAALMEQLREVDVEKNPDKALKLYLAAMDQRNATYMSTELGGRRVEKIPLDIAALGIDQLRSGGGAIEVLEGYAGVALNFIEATRNNRPTDLAINVPNRGQIPFLSQGDIVEITCTVDGGGIHPVELTEEIPEDRALLIRGVKRYERLAVRAIREKSMELGIQALMAHPLVASYSLAKGLMQGYRQAHPTYLGDWK